MDREQLVEQAKSDLSDKLLDVWERTPKRTYLTVEPEHSLAANRWMVDQLDRYPLSAPPCLLCGSL